MLTTNQGLILPDGTDNANVPLTFTDFVTTAVSGIENRLVERYLSTADRTTRNPAPNEGELSYLSDLNRYDTYSGAAWIPLITPAAQGFSSPAVAGLNNPVYTTAGIPLVGATIVVPQSGQVKVTFSGSLDNTSTNATFLAPQLNSGNVVGAGALLVAATDDLAVRQRGTDEVQAANAGIYTGLTPGTSVNAFLNFRTSGASGTIAAFRLILEAA